MTTPTGVATEPEPSDGGGIELSARPWRPGKAIEAPLLLARGHVRAEWIDPNGHMGLSSYAAAMMEAGKHWLEYLGLGYANVGNTGRSSFALHWQMTLERELLVGAQIAFHCQLLDWGHKAFHYFVTLENESEGYTAATSEHLDIHIDMATRRTAPMPPALRAHMEALTAAHGSLPWPEEAGKGIAIRR